MAENLRNTIKSEWAPFIENQINEVLEAAHAIRVATRLATPRHNDLIAKFAQQVQMAQELGFTLVIVETSDRFIRRIRLT